MLRLTTLQHHNTWSTINNVNNPNIINNRKLHKKTISIRATSFCNLVTVLTLQSGWLRLKIHWNLRSNLLLKKKKQIYYWRNSIETRNALDDLSPQSEAPNSACKTNSARKRYSLFPARIIEQAYVLFMGSILTLEKIKINPKVSENVL